MHSMPEPIKGVYIIRNRGADKVDVGRSTLLPGVRGSSGIWQRADTTTGICTEHGPQAFSSEIVEVVVQTSDLAGREDWWIQALIGRAPHAYRIRVSRG